MKCQITLPSHSQQYEILIEEELTLETLKGHRNLFKGQIAIITDTNVAPLYVKGLVEKCQLLGRDVSVYSFPAGEEHKNRETKMRIEDALLEKGLGRETTIVGLGGGVVTDVAGYLAATYCRGVSHLFFPTSLLAMVDASIGGKSGVNTRFGKNLIGCVYQPKAVMIDLSTLTTLPLIERKRGVVEMIKHTLIADKESFAYLEEHLEKILLLEKPFLQRSLYESICMKALIVQEDEKEKGKRRLLNFGHTIGHALESVSDYQLSHGEAVAMGILAESYLSMRLGYLSEESLDRIIKIISRLDVFSTKFSFSLDKILHAMSYDKKSIRQVPKFVILQEIGKPLSFQEEYCSFTQEALIVEALQWMFSKVENQMLSLGIR